MATQPLVDKTTSPIPADRIALAEELLDLAERAQTHTRAAGTAIALKLGEKLYVRTSSGLAPEVGASLTIGEGAIGQCARTGKPCNVSEEDKIEPNLRALGVRSLVAVPIHHAGIFYGVLVAVAQAAEAFTRMQVAIMMTMGNEVARVIKRMEPAAMEIAPGAPLRSSAPAPGVPDDNVVEIALSPQAKQDIVETLKAIEQKPATEQKPPVIDQKPAPTEQKPAPMKLMIDTPLAPKPASAPVAPALPAAVVAAQHTATVEADTPKPLPDLLPPGEDPRRFGTLKNAKSLEPKPTYVAANAFAQPRQSSSMKAPVIAAAVLLIAITGFAIWRYGKPNAPARQVVAATVAPATATTPPAAPAVSTPAPEPTKTSTAAAPVVEAPVKSELAKKEPEAKPEEPKPAEVPLHVAAPAKHFEVAPAVAPPNLVLASNTSLPDLGTPKVPAASLLVKHTSAVPATVSRQIAPTYPEMARRSGIFGIVKLQVGVSAQGLPSSVRVIDGPPMLRAAAANAVSRWLFHPATLDGKAVESTMEVTVRFSQP